MAEASAASIASSRSMTVATSPATPAAREEGCRATDTVVLNAHSRISDNRADGGGAVSRPRGSAPSTTAPSTLTLNDDSSISGNTARRSWGGGVENLSAGFGLRHLRGHGTVTMNDSSSISGNTAHVFGGGVHNFRRPHLERRQQHQREPGAARARPPRTVGVLPQRGRRWGLGQGRPVRLQCRHGELRGHWRWRRVLPSPAPSSARRPRARTSTATAPTTASRRRLPLGGRHRGRSIPAGATLLLTPRRRRHPERARDLAR